MNILDNLGNLKEGDEYQIKLDVTIGEMDTHALNMLAWLYNDMDDGATYADVERVLLEAIWWHITFSTLISADGRIDTTTEPASNRQEPDARVLVSVRHGIAEVEDSPSDTEVVILDYDALEHGDELCAGCYSPTDDAATLKAAIEYFETEDGVIPLCSECQEAIGGQPIF